MIKIFMLILIIPFGFLLYGKVLGDVVPGNVFVVDDHGYIFTNQGDHTILKYSPDGKLLLSIGKKGNGPSDIKRLGWFSINPNDNAIYVTEYVRGNKWISKFSKSGKFLGESGYNLNWEKTKWDGLGRIIFTGKGTAYIKREIVQLNKIKDFLLMSSEKSVLEFSASGKQIGEIYKCKVDSVISDFNTNISIPFQKDFFIEVSDEKLILAENDSEFVMVYGEGGKLEKKIPLPFKMESVTSADKDSWYKGLLESPWAKQGFSQGWLKKSVLKFYRERMPFPGFKPVSGAMCIAPFGILYIQKFNNNKKAEKIWAEIDLKNGESKIVKSKPMEELLTIQDNDFFIARYNEDEEKIVLKTVKKNFFYE